MTRGNGRLDGAHPSRSSRPVVADVKQRNVVSARLTRRAESSVAPRYYVDSSSESSASSTGGGGGDEVLVYSYRDPNLDGEFSLLRPHLEFNELDLQELFSKEGRAGSESSSSSHATSAAAAVGASGSSQLYEEFEEVEIGHFRPATSLDEEGEPSNSPFFFATTLPDNQSTAAAAVEEELDFIPLTLPPWLSLNQARFAPLKLRKLQRDLGPHLSSKQIEQVVSAIHLSSGDDYKKVAGSADFCSILVNSLEMTDVPTLCAAAFHYSSLVSVREHELDIHEESCSVEENECLQTAGSDAKYLCALAGSGIENFGTHAVKIALDAAKLKSMETLATTVVRKNGKLGPLRSGDARNLRSLLLTVNEEGDWRALAIRSAACLYRLEGLEAYRSMMSTAGGPKKTRFATPDESRASQEALRIYAPLAARLGMFRLKTELEDAAFRTLYPRSHAKVSALCGGENTNSVGEGMNSVLSDISNQMKRLVQEDCSFMENIENVFVTARVKEPYSIWRKMLKISKEGGNIYRDISILDIPDAVATRAVFSARKLTPDESDATTQRREKELCYYLFDLCTRNWLATSDSKIKDYVKSPKDNGYQSLHYSTRKRWRGKEWPFEVQIRSSDMHRVAEYGVAAHWSYKGHGIDGDDTTGSTAAHRLDRTSEAYLKSAQEWQTKQATRSYADSSEQPPSELEELPALYLEEEIRRQKKRDRDETLAPYLEALSGAQTDMTRENVYVFVSVQPPKKEGEESSDVWGLPSAPLSEGTVLSLPRGSRVLDAIRVTEKWSSTLESSGNLYDGRSSFVALRNGFRTSSMGTELLASGDVVCILPSNELVLYERRDVVASLVEPPSSTEIMSSL